MKYIESNLLENEIIIYKAGLHWIILLNFFSTLFISISLMLLSAITNKPVLLNLGGAMLIVAVIFFVIAIIKYITTEIAITSKRIIYKSGFIRRDTIELNLSKTESVKVIQDISGRLLGYGTLLLSGTGGGETPIKILAHHSVFGAQRSN